jgi:hypothetical protein
VAGSTKDNSFHNSWVNHYSRPLSVYWVSGWWSFSWVCLTQSQVNLLQLLYFNPIIFCCYWYHSFYGIDWRQLSCILPGKLSACQHIEGFFVQASGNVTSSYTGCITVFYLPWSCWYVQIVCTTGFIVRKRCWF